MKYSNYIEEIVDEYGGREIHRRRRGIAMDFEDIRADMVADMVSREMREEIGQEAVREVLFYKDREKTVSFLQRVLGDYFFYQDDFVQSRNWFARSLRQDSKNGYSLSRLGIIDILEGREKEGVEQVIKGGEIEQVFSRES